MIVIEMLGSESEEVFVVVVLRHVMYHILNMINEEIHALFVRLVLFLLFLRGVLSCDHMLASYFFIFGRQFTL